MESVITCLFYDYSNHLSRFICNEASSYEKNTDEICKKISIQSTVELFRLTLGPIRSKLVLRITRKRATFFGNRNTIIWFILILIIPRTTNNFILKITSDFFYVERYIYFIILQLYLIVLESISALGSALIKRV